MVGLVEQLRAAESAAAPREETPRKTWARLRRRLRCRVDGARGYSHEYMTWRDIIIEAARRCGCVEMAVWAQRPSTSVIGFLRTEWAELLKGRLRRFPQGLSETGYVRGQNVKTAPSPTAARFQFRLLGCSVVVTNATNQIAGLRDKARLWEQGRGGPELRRLVVDLGDLPVGLLTRSP